MPKNGNTCRSFSVHERRYKHCGQSREEDGGNVKKSGRSNEGLTAEARRKMRKNFEAERAKVKAGFKNEEHARQPSSKRNS